MRNSTSTHDNRLANREVYDASCTLGIFIYSKYARLFHLPRVLTVESPSPLAAAVVAATMRKLCPEY